MESFGARLRRERERLGISLDDIALSTKIGTRMLRALEDEHFEQLPGGVFNKGFVRAYARHLGIDEQQAITDYLAATGEALPDKKPDGLKPAEADIQVKEIQAAETSDRTARIPWGMLAVALLIVAGAFALWGFYSRDKEKEKSSSSAVKVAPSASPSPAVSPAAGGQGLSTGPAAQPSRPAPVSPAPQEIPAVAPDSAANSAAHEPVSSPAPGMFVVLIRARQDSWVSIAADGKIMIETLIAPAEKSVEARNHVVVKAGNIGALDFWFNGQKLPPQGGYDQVKVLNFDAHGLQPSPAQPSATQTIPPP